MKKVLVSVLAAMYLVLVSSSPLLALEKSKEDVIRTNCRPVQSILNQLEKVDAALRINRGRLYNDVINLLYAMNARLANNHITAPKMVSTTSKIEQLVKQFREDYPTYDDNLTELIKMDCQKSPGLFYDRLVKFRQGRANLGHLVGKIDDLIREYSQQFNQFKDSYREQN